MKAISLWQPWASLWIAGPKMHETRHWPTSHRGPLAVHAAKRLVTDCGADVDELCIDRFGAHWRKTLPRGALIGSVDLEACTLCDDELRESLLTLDPSDFECGDFSTGRYAWRRGPFPHSLMRPVPYVGRQGFFNVPDELVSRLS